jgi:hypothetical protein
MASKYDITNETVLAFGIHATLSGTTPAKGNIVAVDDYRHAFFAFSTGTVTDAGTASGFAVEIQESDDTADTNFSAVADADLFGVESDLTVTDDAHDSKPVGLIGYAGGKKYVRAVVTGTTGTDAVVAGSWILQKNRYRPTASDIAANVAAT